MKVLAGALIASVALTTAAFAGGDNKASSSSGTVTTVEAFCADTRLTAKDQADCRAELRAATTEQQRMTIMRSYETRLGATPLRNDLSSDDAGVKGATQPAAPRIN